MSAGLAALLDDVAAIARVAAASVDDVAAGASRASVKAAGVIVDDTAVTPRYVQDFRPERELPMIKRIAVGSLRNKILLILPVALVLSELLPWLLNPILMIGGVYLCFEGAEKLWELISPHAPRGLAGRRPGARARGRARRQRDPHGLHPLCGDHGHLAQRGRRRAAALPCADPGVRRARDHRRGLRRRCPDREDGRRRAPPGHHPGRSGRGVRPRPRGAMPIVLSVLAKVGIAAMLWVGGHILLVGLDELGLSAPYDLVHHLEEDVHDALGGRPRRWLTNTAASALLGSSSARSWSRSCTAGDRSVATERAVPMPGIATRSASGGAAA